MSASKLKPIAPKRALEESWVGLLAAALLAVTVASCTPYGAPPREFISIRSGETFEKDHDAVVQMLLSLGFVEDDHATTGGIVNPSSSSPWKILKMFRLAEAPLVYVSTNKRYPRRDLEIRIIENQRTRPVFPKEVREKNARLYVMIVEHFGQERINQ